MSKKIVVKLDLHDNKDKQKAMKAVAALVGIDAISMDMASQKMTVIGTVDPVAVVSRLRKQAWAAHIDSVGPAKEPEKKEEKKDEAKEEEGKKDEPKKDDDAKKDDGKKDDGKKDEAKKDDGGGEKKPAPVPPPPPQPTPEQQHQKMITELINQQYKAYNPYMTTHYFVRSMEENPNSCVIC